ncbi:MAG: SUF system Fe-S cluster assembly regulator [Gammaproteobacteria bacterium]
MFKISKLADYATLLMTYFARQDEQQQFAGNARHIAEATGLTLHTVRKLLKMLAKAQLLVSQRGSKGGYRLARPASAISVAQVIEAIEPSHGLTECSEKLGSCALEPICHMQHNWRIINQAIHAAIDSVTLADLAKPVVSNTVISVDKIKYLVGTGHGKSN